MAGLPTLKGGKKTAGDFSRPSTVPLLQGATDLTAPARIALRICRFRIVTPLFAMSCRKTEVYEPGHCR